MARARKRTASAKRNADALGVVEWEKGMDLNRVLAIDPGAVNCGMAQFDLMYRPDAEWHCTDAWKMGPLEALFFLEHFIGDQAFGFDVGVVCEQFRLYPGKAAEQGFSAMGTPQVIGAVMWQLARENVRRRDEQLSLIPLRLQQASSRLAGCAVLSGSCHWAKTCGAWCGKRPGQGIHHDGDVHMGPNVHARDAEAHGWLFIAKKMAGPLQLSMAT